MKAFAESKKIQALAISQLVMALGIIIFWILFFTVNMVDIDDPELQTIYKAFEHSFVLPDLLLSLFLIMAALYLFNGNPKSFIYSLIAGAMLIFLGLLDISFNIGNHIYELGMMEAMMNGFINLTCLTFGVVLICFGHKAILCPPSLETKRVAETLTEVKES